MDTPREPHRGRADRALGERRTPLARAGSFLRGAYVLEGRAPRPLRRSRRRASSSRIRSRSSASRSSSAGPRRCSSTRGSQTSTGSSRMRGAGRPAAGGCSSGGRPGSSCTPCAGTSRASRSGASTGPRPPAAVELMIKELEDAPRDETAVVLDADAAAVVGEAPDSTFELQVRIAGSIVNAHARPRSPDVPRRQLAYRTSQRVPPSTATGTAPSSCSPRSSRTGTCRCPASSRTRPGRPRGRSSSRSSRPRSRPGSSTGSAPRGPPPRRLGRLRGSGELRPALARASARGLGAAPAPGARRDPGARLRRGDDIATALAERRTPATRGGARHG